MLLSAGVPLPRGVFGQLLFKTKAAFQNIYIKETVQLLSDSPCFLFFLIFFFFFYYFFFFTNTT